METQDITFTPQQIYDWATSSADNRLRFIIITHYAQILARAESAGLVRGNVGGEALFLAIKAAEARPSVYSMVLNITPDTSNMSAAAAEAWQRIYPQVASSAPQSARVAFSQRSAPYYCADNFTGPLPPDAQPCPSSGGGGGSGSDWFNSDIFGTVLENVPEIGNAIACWVNPQLCNAQPVPPGGGPTPPPPAADKPNYVPWIIGGAVFITFMAVILIVVLRKK